MEGRQLKRCQDGFEEVGVNTDRGSPILPAKHHSTRPKLHKEAFQPSSALPSLEVNLYGDSLRLRSRSLHSARHGPHRSRLICGFANGLSPDSCILLRSQVGLDAAAKVGLSWSAVVWRCGGKAEVPRAERFDRARVHNNIIWPHEKERQRRYMRGIRTQGHSPRIGRDHAYEYGPAFGSVGCSEVGISG